MATVKLVAATPNAEALVADVARISSPQNQGHPETAPRLIAYLIQHQHWSPFEHAFFTLEVTTSRAIAAQLLRHRGFTFQEFSQRYATINAADEPPLVPARAPAGPSRRQSSIDVLPAETKAWFEEQQHAVWESCHNAYTEALARGIAREQARFLLPLSTPTRLYVSGSIRQWIHYIGLRSQEDTQPEHRDIALAARAVLAPLIPTIAAALGWA